MGRMRRMRRLRESLTVVCIGWAVILLAARAAEGDSFRLAGTEFDAKRTVSIKPDELRPVMVVEFLHQSLIRRDKDDASSGNVLVAGKNNRPLPTRILQLGPGDFCRLAFETVAGQNSYEIYYGGQSPGDPPPGKQSPKKDLVPKWTNTDGLILDTRRFGRCNLHDLDSLRRAFEKAKPMGADYVESVYHSHNPTSPTAGPFLSRYAGKMNISAAGNYTFWTSSQDCSFVLIDDKLVVSAPGRHGPLRRARPASGKTLRLSAGQHKFEYYHAAAGSETVMSLAWLKGPAGDKPRPTGIEPAVFIAASIGRAEAGPASTRAKKAVPDFRFKVAGEVPLPGETQPLLGVSFRDASPPGLATKSKFLWDFGDGQTSERQSPAHVYLRPGLYTVALSIKRGTRALTTTNRISIERPLRTRRSKEKPHKLDDYLGILSTYDAKRLDVASARQLVLAFLWKAETLAESEKAEEKQAAADHKSKSEEKPKRPQSRRIQEAAERRAAAEAAKKVAARRAESQKYLAMAVDVGRNALAGGDDKSVKASVSSSDDDIFKLAELVGPLARNRLGDSSMAFTIWQNAAARISQPVLKANCQLAAADIAIGDLLKPKLGKGLLDLAAAGLPKNSTDPAVVRLDRIWGDYWAFEGNGKAARKAYAQAQRSVNKSRSHVEKIAWRGAHSRSVEQYLKTEDWARAMEELQLWQEAFPADKIDGYLSLLLGRYWNGRGKYAQAVALSEQLVAVNHDSPYADQLLLLGAACEKKLDKPQRAEAMLHSIIKDYPGSPLVPTAKRMLVELKK